MKTITFICECGHKDKISSERIKKNEVINKVSCHKCHDRKIIEAGLKMFNQTTQAGSK